MEPSLADAVRRGYATVAQMSARLEVFALQAGARVEDVEADFGKLRIRARRYSERMRDGSLRHVVQLFKGHDPLNVIEDLAEDAWVRALEQKLVTPEQLIGWVREAEAATGNAYLERGYAHDAAEPMKLLEALSAISREYALDRIHAGEGFPARLKEWLDLIVGMTAAVFGTAREVALRLGRGAKLRRAFEGGALPAEFLAQVEDSIGLNAEARERRSREGDGKYEEGSTSAGTGDRTDRETIPREEEEGKGDMDSRVFRLAERGSDGRDAVKVAEITARPGLTGQRRDLRSRALAMVEKVLGGRAILNRSEGQKIHFTEIDRIAFPGRLRSVQDFRAAMHLEEIVEHGVHLGSELPPPGMRGVKRIEHFALPVKVDGARALATFSTRTLDDGKTQVFHDFSLRQSDRIAAGPLAGQTEDDFREEAVRLLFNGRKLPRNAADEEVKRRIDAVLNKLNRKATWLNPLTLRKYEHRKSPWANTGGPPDRKTIREELFATELELTPEERMTAHETHEIGSLYGPRGEYEWSDSDYLEHFGPPVVPPGDNYTLSHQHPNGSPPSLGDLYVLVEFLPEARNIHGTVLRIVAPQKDGSFMLYRMRVTEKLTEEERRNMIKAFKDHVDSGDDTMERRLRAMELTIAESNGKLSFEQRSVQ